MPRFDRLELDPGSEPPDRPGPRAPEERDARHWLRQAEEERCKRLYEGALRYYSRALEEHKTLIPGWLGQVQMLIALEEYPEADLWSRKALELFRSNGELLASRAQAVCRAGDVRAAQPLCDAALAQAGQSAYRWTVRGELMVATRQDIDRHCFEKAVQLDPDWLVSLEIALIYLYYRQSSKALARARLAVEKAPDRPYAWYVQGQCEDELGLDQRAKKSLERCLELAPHHSLAQQHLSRIANRGWSLTRRLRRLFRC